MDGNMFFFFFGFLEIVLERVENLGYDNRYYK